VPAQQSFSLEATVAEKWAFALKESFSKDFAGGSTTITDGKTLDFGARLRNSEDGVIVVTDPIEADALERMDSLKSVPVPDEPKGERKAAPTPTPEKKGA
jgi:hypothetical protein